MGCQLNGEEGGRAMKYRAQEVACINDTEQQTQHILHPQSMLNFPININIACSGGLQWYLY